LKFNFYSFVLALERDDVYMIKKGSILILILFLAFTFIIPAATAAVRLPDSLKAPFNVSVEAQNAELIIKWENPSGIPELSDELYRNYVGYIRVLIDWRLNDGAWHFANPIPDGQYLSSYYFAAAPHFLISVYDPTGKSKGFSSTSINKLVFNIPFDVSVTTWLQSNKLEFRLRYILDYFDETTMTTRYILSPFSYVAAIGTYKGNDNPSDKNTPVGSEQSPKKEPETGESANSKSPVEAETQNSQAFKNASSWAIKELEQAKAIGLITEKIANDVKSPITREEFTEIVVKLYEIYTKSPIEIGSVTFRDTSNPEILKAAGLSLVEGTGNNEFSPNKNISRQEMATILYRAMQKINNKADYTVPQVQPYDDHHSIETWALDGVYYCTGAGIFMGVGNNTFAPQGQATREQAVLVCKRAYEFLNVMGGNTVEAVKGIGR